MAENETKTRGPMTANARVLMAVDRFEALHLTSRANAIARLKNPEGPQGCSDEAADELDRLAALLRIAAKLDAEGRARLLKFIS